jgi:hypothetical protein
MRNNPEEIEVVAQPIAGQQQRPIGVELHGDDGLKSFGFKSLFT